MLERDVEIVWNRRDTDSYYRLVVRAPDIAPLVQPGQFAHVRILALREALLRRPFSIFQVQGDTLGILYKVVGKGTEVLSRLGPGDRLNVIAPLGHGFSVPTADGPTPLLVAGGYGAAALYLLAERAGRRGIAFVGGRTQTDILCERELGELGWEVRVSTEDGSRGHRGLVTEPLVAELQRDAGQRKLFACGPMPMLKAVAQIAAQFGVAAEVSLDTTMCCGLGVCLTCVVPVRAADGWEYARACTEGPVFEARQVAWELLS
jgi:dihydroorotate dehydrogenase electron transfer subunit